jgi:hypothetical protein
LFAKNAGGLEKRARDGTFRVSCACCWTLRLLQRPIPVKSFANVYCAAGARRVVFEEGQIVDADRSSSVDAFDGAEGNNRNNDTEQTISRKCTVQSIQQQMGTAPKSTRIRSNLREHFLT